MINDEALPSTLRLNREPVIPYPGGLGRWLLRLPLFFYRLGLGDLMNAAHIMILGTRGRKSGLPRYTSIEYRRHGSKIYVVSAWGERPHWFGNLQTSPDVLVQHGRRQFGARAVAVTNPGEALRVLHLFRRRAPFVYDPIIARLSARERVNERTLPEVSQEITIVRLDPVPDAPAVPPLPASYGWVLPGLLALGFTLLLGIGLTRSRQRGDD
ncbi:MAG: nitroreductase family deazaflavin-dependent oxidoreductase [Chloroflexota bacterium]